MDAQVQMSSVPPPTLRRLLYAGALAAALAVVVNLAVYFISRTLFEIDYVIPPAPNSTDAIIVSATNVVLDTVIMAVGATLVFALLSKFSSHPVRQFLILSVIVLGLSFIFPLLLPVALPMKFSLSLMHLAAAVIMVGSLLRFG